jgi:aryl-alcohol dehydrogenase-like predicted oxidoreductase
MLARAGAASALLLIGSTGNAARAAASSAARAGTLRIGHDLVVRRMGFGALRLLGPAMRGYPKDPANARAVARRAIELGVNLIDTADAYGPDIDEELIYQALYPYPRDLVITTKGGWVQPAGQRGVADGSPEHLREACEGSLKRLHLERIDLYQLHYPDPKIPIEESIGTLKRLQTEGKIRHIGVSNVTLEQLKRAETAATIVSVQNQYSVANRTSEDVLNYCEARRMAFMPWGPLAGPRGPNAKPDTSALDRFEPLEKKYGISPQQAALAWLLARSKVMLPIPGTGEVSHLEENVAAAGVHFTTADMQSIG